MDYLTSSDDLSSLGFTAEEASIALEQSGGDAIAALILLLERLRSQGSAVAATDPPETDEALQEEASVLVAIYDDAFALESLAGHGHCLRLRLTDLQPAGELRLLIPPGSAYPEQPCLPMFIPLDAHAAIDAPGVKVSLARALAEQAARLAAEASPACHELCTWLADELPAFLAQPPPRPPQLVLTAKEQARKEHYERIGAAHKECAQAASDQERERERQAAAHGMTFEEYLKAIDSYPIREHEGALDPEEVAALKARLAAGPIA